VSDVPALSPAAREDLLRLARAAIQAHFSGGPPPRLDSDRAETFGEPRGLFVTLRKAGQLRGCIGTLSPDGDLTRIVAQYALRAAFEDPRFPPLTAEELAACDIEISVMDAPRPISGPEEIAVGQDGLILEAGRRRGLLLPQVATEWDFDAVRFLEAVCEKAGLAPGDWRAPGTRLWAFRAEVFGE
jgi:uncharacterized protein